MWQFSFTEAWAVQGVCVGGGEFGEVSVKHESVKASAVGISKLTLLTFLGFDDLVWVKQTIGGRQKAYSVWLEWV